MDQKWHPKLIECAPKWPKLSLPFNKRSKFRENWLKFSSEMNQIKVKEKIHCIRARFGTEFDLKD